MRRRCCAFVLMGLLGWFAAAHAQGGAAPDYDEYGRVPAEEGDDLMLPDPVLSPDWPQLETDPKPEPFLDEHTAAAAGDGDGSDEAGDEEAVEEAVEEPTFDEDPALRPPEPGEAEAPGVADDDAVDPAERDIAGELEPDPLDGDDDYDDELGDDSEW